MIFIIISATHVRITITNASAVKSIAVIYHAKVKREKTNSKGLSQSLDMACRLCQNSQLSRPLLLVSTLTKLSMFVASMRTKLWIFVDKPLIFRTIGDCVEFYVDVYFDVNV